MISFCQSILFSTFCQSQFFTVFREKIGLGQLEDQSLTKDLAEKTGSESEIAKGQESDDAGQFIKGLVLLVVSYGLGLLLEIWFFLIVRGAYIYCRDKTEFQKAQWEGVPLSAKA